MMVDSHVHFWDPDRLRYAWQDSVPALRRAFLPSDYQREAAVAPVEQIIFVEASCRPPDVLAEVEFVSRFIESEPRLTGLVAFANLANESERDRALEALAGFPKVKGIRHNLQRESAGFAVQREFIEGVRALGRHDLTFDICVLHAQLPDIIELVAEVSNVRFVLDHCGKPPIRDRIMEPWRTHIRRLAAFDHVSCKLSGLITEAAADWKPEDLVPYADHILNSFGHERVMFGSDWPVVTQTGSFSDWYSFTEHFVEGWSAEQMQRFYHDNAIRFYGL
jgi:L-fuconolactonase